jgi:hypothetical protein
MKKNWIYFKRSNGDIDQMPFRDGLETEEKVKDFLGLDSITDFEILEEIKEIKSSKEELFSQLWTACTNYRKERISEEGMLFLFPYKATGKAKAVYDWVQSLWDEYYTRKATIDAGGVPSFDFKALGEMPHTFLEVRQEIEG